MNNLFFKDVRGNFWSVNKVIGLVRDVQTTEEGEELVHFLAVLDGGMSTELSATLFAELTRSLIILEAAENGDAEAE